LVKSQLEESCWPVANEAVSKQKTFKKSNEELLNGDQKVINGDQKILLKEV
jgi:hypothetical protein